MKRPNRTMNTENENIKCDKTIQIQRQIHHCHDQYSIDKKSMLFNLIQNRESIKQFYDRQRYKCSFKSFIFGFFPILQWLPNYNIRSDFLPDLIAGCTVLALNIPQGLAYGHLAGAEPIHGLYVSFFPVIIYSFLGTSRHISVGTFTVISIACKDVVESFQLDQDVIVRSTLNVTAEIPDSSSNLRPIDVLTSLCLLVGIIQFCLGVLRLGILSVLLSDTLVSAFLVASSIHVFTTQVFDFIGVESSKGDDYEIPLPMEIINAYIRFFSRLGRTNLATLFLSIICLLLLIGCKYVLQPYLLKKYRLKTLAIPIDIALIIIFTLLSALFDFNQKFGIHIIPNIPKGFEDIPKVPATNLMFRMVPGAILVCLISYLLSYSLGKMYGKQYGYKINPNQELIALGVANVFSSFFQCYPCCASLSRSAVQERVGGRTQLVNIISASFMLIILLFFSTYFQYLPKCVLSSIICVAIFNTMQTFPKEIHKAWQASPIDGALWLATFLLVVLFGVGHGLLYSLLLSFAMLILKLITPKMKLKYRLDETELFLEIQDGQFEYNRESFYHCLSIKNSNENSSPNGVVDQQKWLVFEYQGPLMFINALLFRTQFYSLIGCFIVEMYEREHLDGSKCNLTTIILDCSRLTSIDAKGVEAILETQALLQKYQSQIVLAACSETVFRNLKKFKFFNNFKQANCYISVIDAVMDLK